jgi:SAM-dependent methyltransferase
MPHAGLADYYQRRAREYEAVYAKPERQADLLALHHWLAACTSGRRVLEVACGTGYWTRTAADTAATIVATDYNDAPLAIARSKNYRCPVRFEQADAYRLGEFGGRFDCAMAHFWWSHVPIGALSGFLKGVAGQLEPGAVLLFADNRFVEGSSTPIGRTDHEGNTYQRRRLEDGSEHEVLKNFPTVSEIRQRLSEVTGNIEVVELEYYWAARAVVEPL